MFLTLTFGALSKLLIAATRDIRSDDAGGNCFESKLADSLNNGAPDPNLRLVLIGLATWLKLKGMIF